MPRYVVEYKSNNNVVYSCKYHVIWCPKHRRPVLVPEVAARLGIRLEAARQVYNACLGEALRRTRLLRERRTYRRVRRLPKGEERNTFFRAARRSVEFTDAAVQRYAVRLRQRAFPEHPDVHVVQKLASRAFAAVNAWLLGKRGRPRFKGYRQLDTVEGKPLLRAAWSEATQPARGRAFRPPSFGAAPRSRSGSPAEEGIAYTEARNVVAHVLACGESPGEVAAVPLRTPRL